MCMEQNCELPDAIHRQTFITLYSTDLGSVSLKTIGAGHCYPALLQYPVYATVAMC